MTDGPSLAEAMAEAYRDGDFALAAEHAMAILAGQPDHVDAIRHLVRVHTNRKETALAKPLWQRLTELMPDVAEPHLQLARIARLEKDWPAAVDHITRFLATAPDHAEALGIQVQGFLSLKAADRIGPAFARLIQVQPRGAAALANQAARLGMTAEIAASLRALADAGDPDAVVLCRSLSRAERDAAIGFEIQANTAGAAQSYRTMRTLDPASTYPTTSLARLRKPALERARQAYQAGDDAQAIALSQDCIAIEPQEAEPYIIAGRAAGRDNDYATAFAILDRGMAHCAPDLWLTVNYARAAERSGEHHAAFQAFSRIREDGSEAARRFHPEADRSLGRLPERIARQGQTLAEAGRCLEAFQALDMIEAQGLIPADALATFRQRVTTAAQRQLRELYEANAPEARPLAEALTAFAPNEPYAFRVLGRLLLRARDYGRALPCWVRLCEIEPGSVEFRLNAARCHFRLKDYRAAAAGARALLDLDPHHTEGLQILNASGGA